LCCCSAWISVWIFELLTDHRQAVAVGVPTLALAALAYVSIKFAWWPRLGWRQLRIALVAAGPSAALMFYFGV
jgi:hypothetical protein